MKQEEQEINPRAVNWSLVRESAHFFGLRPLWTALSCQYGETLGGSDPVHPQDCQGMDGLLAHIVAHVVELIDVRVYPWDVYDAEELNLIERIRAEVDACR